MRMKRPNWLIVFVLLVIWIAGIGYYLYFNHQKEINYAQSAQKYQEGLNYLKENFYDGAMGAFLAATELDPKNDLAWIGLGDTLVWSSERRDDQDNFDQEDLNGAINAFKKAIEANPENAEAHLKLATCLAEHETNYSSVEGWWIFSHTTYYRAYDQLNEAKQEAVLALKYSNSRAISESASKLLDKIADKG